MPRKKQSDSVAIWVIVAIFCLAIIIFLKPESGVSGSSINIREYGVSDYQVTEEGKIQANVNLMQSVLMDLDSWTTRTSVAENIVKKSNMVNGLINLYQENPPTIIPSGALDAVRNGANKISEEFINANMCLKRAGYLYGHQEEGLDFIITTEWRYRKCRDRHNEDWLASFVKHNYYTDEGEFICGQDSDLLFAINLETGETSTDTYNC